MQNFNNDAQRLVSISTQLSLHNKILSYCNSAKLHQTNYIALVLLRFRSIDGTCNLVLEHIIRES